MKKKIITVVCILLTILSFIPLPVYLKDGGTVGYYALLYQVSHVHSISGTDDTGKVDYLEGTSVRILGIEVYNDVK